ncbi:protein rep, partial [Staphylococcus aureus]|nr:protein rep [Staphylococcus aureus]
KNLNGFMRTTEVTVNSNDGSYNQHLHVLLCVEPTYFKNKENYIEQNEWIKFWKRALKINYEPVVHVNAITPKRKKDSAIVSA